MCVCLCLTTTKEILAINLRESKGVHRDCWKEKRKGQNQYNYILILKINKKRWHVILGGKRDEEDRG